MEISKFGLLFALFATLLLSPFTSYASKFAPSLPDRKQAFLGAAVYIRIFKEERTLELYVKQKDKYLLLEKYPICTYSGGLGPKVRQRDYKSPEGFYQTKRQQLNPNSKYHLSFNIGYPNDFDKSHGYTGKYLMIHGDCVSEGCYAMGDNNIEEIYLFMEKALANGQDAVDIHIYPFRMTEKNMRRHRNSEHYDFWRQLQPGYNYFEASKIPPMVYISDGKYFVFPQEVDQVAFLK